MNDIVHLLWFVKEMRPPINVPEPPNLKNLSPVSFDSWQKEPASLMIPLLSRQALP